MPRRQEAGGELGAGHVGRGREGLALAVARVVAGPRGDATRGVEPATQLVEAARAVEVVAHVVFARPLQLHRCADHARNPRGFHRVVVGEPPAEAAAGAQQVRRHLRRRDAERLRHGLAATFRRLARRPQLHAAVLPVRQAVLRLERRVGHERIAVGGLHRLRRRLQRRVGVAEAAQGECRPLREVLLGVGLERRRALHRRRPFVPGDLQRIARRLRLPVAVGHDRHAARKIRVRPLRLDHERMAYARHRLQLIDVGAGHAAAEHRALLVDRPEHAGHREVDAEHRLAGDDLLHAHRGHRRTDDAVVLRIFQSHRARIGHRQRGRRRRQLAVAE